MEQHPLVTIVIPVYNVEKYLERCINSVVNQTYGNLEIILVDDGSPDNCPEICDAWAQRDSRIRVIHKKNAGLGMARNTGLENATGDYICFFDSDDYVERDTIECALSTAIKHSAQIVIFGSRDVNTDGEITAVFVPASEETCIRGQAVREELLPDLIDPGYKDAKYPQLILSAWCCIYDMSLLRNTQFRFVSERRIISEDSYSLIWLYSYVKSVVLLPKAKYYYCKNASSLTHTYRANRFERIKQFYSDTTEMAKKQGYGEKVLSRIGGLFLAFAIAAIKQIVSADIGWKRKRDSIDGLLRDPLLQDVLSDPGLRYRRKTRQIMIHMMRKGAVGAVMLFALLQNRKNR